MPKRIPLFPINQDSVIRPLMVACSGGGGHIAAIQGIYSHVKPIKNIYLPDYSPKQYDPLRETKQRKQIDKGIEILHAPGVGPAIQNIVAITPFPLLPDRQALDDEIEALASKQFNTRPYIDMLLDVYPAGYESAAIWNILQREDLSVELTKLIALQKESDALNHETVRNYFLTLLQNAAITRTPYTVLVSTQAMALPALCDAVREYNAWIAKTPQIEAEPIYIHQYMTDLPTTGAVHFFNSLANLSTKQQQVMRLFAVDVDNSILEKLFPIKPQFADICSVSAKENPMVRPGFKDPSLDKSNQFHEDLDLQLCGIDAPVRVAGNEQIASIMLGSQAGKDTLKYIETLIQNGMSKIFVFGGTTGSIRKGLDALIKENPEYKTKIIALANQSDKEIAPLMSRSNMVIIRGGGLSVMEQLAMNHSPEQTILVHHAHAKDDDLSSGIIWEDKNVDCLIDNLSSQHVYIDKTSPANALRDIPEARLIAAIKRIYDLTHVGHITYYIKKLSKEKLREYVLQLIDSDVPPNPQLPEQLVEYLSHCEGLDLGRIYTLKKKLSEARAYVISQILKTEGIEDNEDFPNLLAKLRQKPELSTEVATLLLNYDAVRELEIILEDDSKSPNQIIDDFAAKFKDPELREKLTASDDNFIMYILKAIERLLAEWFPSMPIRLSFHYALERELKNTVEIEVSAIRLNSPAYGCTFRIP